MGLFDWLIIGIWLAVMFALALVATLLYQIVGLIKRMESKLDTILSGPWED